MHQFQVAGGWVTDWTCGLPLIVFTVVVHVGGLALIGERVIHVMSMPTKRRGRFPARFIRVMSVTSPEVSVLHGMEAGIRAGPYRIIRALPDYRSAMLYSLNAITSYGHTNLFLHQRWQVDGSTGGYKRYAAVRTNDAFLFAIIQRVSPLGGDSSAG